jgi:hypothetical protein
MFGLGEAVPLQLTIDTPYQVVGGAPKFTLIGAPPGATIFWSSYKDGVATPEFNANYNQLVEANGTARLTGGAWTGTDVAREWTKEVLIQSPDGTNNRAMVQFTVSAAPTPTPAGTVGSAQPAAGSFWENPLFSIGDFEVTPAVAGIGLAALYFFTKKK